MSKIFRLTPKRQKKLHKLFSVVAIFSLFLQLGSGIFYARPIIAEEPPVDEETIETPQEPTQAETSAEVTPAPESNSTPEVSPSPEPTPTAEPPAEVTTTPAEEVTPTPIIEEDVPPVEYEVPPQETSPPLDLEKPIEDPTSGQIAPTPIPTPAPICLNEGQEIKDTTNEDWNINLEEGWAQTKESVKLGVKYLFPQENKVSITFKCLPKDGTSPLKIQKIKISDLNLPEGTNPYGEWAYDITTDMENGTFEYEVTLPKSDNVDAEVAYIEKSAEEVTSEKLSEDDLKKVDKDKVEQENETVKVTNLDHFTVFVVTGSVGSTDADPTALQGEDYLRYVGNPAPDGFSHNYQWGNPFLYCDPNNTEVVFDGTIDTSLMVIGEVAFVGLIDQKLLEGGASGYQSGAYAYIYKKTDTTLRIGPTDGNLGGEIVQVFKDYTIPVTNSLQLLVTINAGSVSVEVDGDTPISDTYGDVKTLNNTNAYDWNEFEFGAVPGWDNFSSGQMSYQFEVNGCTEVATVCPAGNVKYEVDNADYEYTDNSATVSIIPGTNGTKNKAEWQAEAGYEIVDVCIKIGGPGGGTLKDGLLEGGGPFDYDISHVVLTTRPSQQLPICGNGIVEGNEQCDWGSQNGQGYCSIDCTWNNVCLTDVNMIFNGGFETPIVATSQKWDIYPLGTAYLGWNVEWNGGSFTYGGATRPDPANLELHRGVNAWNPQEGSQYTELDTDWDGPGNPLNNEPASVKIYQDIPTIPGYEYEVKFWFSPRPNTSDSDNQLGYGWDNNSEGTASGAGGSNTSWTEYSYIFTATSGITRIYFVDLGTPNSLGTFLDNVSVVCLRPTTGSIKITKDVVPDDDSVWDFTINGMGIPYSTNIDDLGDEQPVTIDNLIPGTYTILEITDPNYSTSVTCVTAGGTVGPLNQNSFLGTVVAGQTLECTFTNTRNPYCGDGIKNGQEECDGTDGVTTGQNFCTQNCTLVPIYNGTYSCPQGTVKSENPVWSGLISGTDSDGETFSLASGGKYLFEASGMFRPTSPQWHPDPWADAGYTTLSGWPNLATQYGIQGSGNDYAAHALLADLGDGVGVVNWGNYNSDHIYTKYYEPTTSNVQFVIGDRYGDWFDTSWQNQTGMNDNSGSLNLDVYECQLPPVTIKAYKVICDGEQYLPDWGGNHGLVISASTAQNFVDNSNRHCQLVDDWKFQYGGIGNFGSFQTETDEKGAPWQTFNVDSDAVIADLTPYGNKIEVREVFPSDEYIGFSNDPGNVGSSVSAEFYCTGDVYNYDNWEWINSPQYGQTYYCVAFNALEKANLTVLKNVDVNGDGDYEDQEDVLGATDWQWDIVNGEQNINTGAARELTVGTYTIKEDQKPHYELVNWSCDNDETGIENEINVDLTQEDVTCTFNNAYQPYCGDGNVDFGEECDGNEGVTEGENFCTVNCELVPIYDGDHSCPPETTPIFKQEVSVSSKEANGVSVNLTSGIGYLFEASGTYSYDKSNSNKTADAAYGTANNWTSTRNDIGIWGTNRGVTSLLGDFGTGEIGVIEWDNDEAYDDDHTYTKFYQPTGNPVRFLISDWYGDWYASTYNNQSAMNDNDGALTLKIYECQENGRLQGTKYLDENADGVHDYNPSLTPYENQLLNGWTIRLYNDNWEFVEETTTADLGNKGQYRFDVAPGTYNICEKMKEGFTQTGPVLGAGSINNNHQPTGNGIAIENNSPNKEEEGLVCWQANLQGGETDGWLKFGNVQYGSIIGHKFEDDNMNGEQNTGESNLSDWTIGIYEGSGCQGQVIGSGTQITDGNGNVTFLDLTPGPYSLKEESQSGWQTTTSVCQDVTVLANEITTINIGNFELGRIQGRKFNDLNGNGQENSGELPINGWTIRLYNSDWLPASSPQITHPIVGYGQGRYLFEGLTLGTYYICEVLPLEWEQTDPGVSEGFANQSGATDEAPRCRQVKIDKSGDFITGRIFGNVQYGSISGMKFEDINGDGIKDTGDDGLENWTIQLKQGETNVNITTAADGTYSFQDVIAGDYQVCEVIEQQGDWIRTYPSNSDCQPVTVIAGQDTPNVDFGNFENGQITACKYDDYDRDGIRDNGEPGIMGVAMALEKMTEIWGEIETGETGEEGCYTFDNLGPGEYRVKEDLTDPDLAGYFPTDDYITNGDDRFSNAMIMNSGDNFTVEYLNDLNPVKLSLTKTHNKVGSKAFRGETLTFTLKVKNTAESTAYGVIVRDVLPYGFSYVLGTGKVDGNNSVPTINNRQLAWNVGEIAAGEEVVITYGVKVGDSQSRGGHANIAVAHGTNRPTGSDDISTTFSNFAFVHTAVEIGRSYSVSIGTGFVLGAATTAGEVLGAATGSPTMLLIIAILMILAGLTILLLKKGKKLHV